MRPGVTGGQSPIFKGLIPFLILCICIVFTAVPAHSAKKTRVENIRFLSYHDHTRVVIDLTGEVEFEDKHLKDPERVFVDLKETGLPWKTRDKLEVGDGILQSIRSAEYTNGVTRVVFDLVQIYEYKVFALKDPPRVVVDLFGDGTVQGHSGEAADHNDAVEASATNDAADVVDTPREPAFVGPAIRRVVIDAGHGGRDPGATGPGGIKEKDIVLDIAQKLKKELLKKGGYKVYLTRERDVFLDLDRRTVVANKQGADLFISIHANANRDKRLKGVETYLLNWTNDAAAMKVAERENRIHVKHKHENRSNLGVILASLELQNKRDESLELAHLVQDSLMSSLRNGYQDVDDLGVRQALFYVLLGARMPSVLVEVSFMTNSLDARRLKTSAYRQRIAEGIGMGVHMYFLNSVPEQKIARN